MAATKNISKNIKDNNLDISSLSKRDKDDLKEGTKLGLLQMLYSIWSVIGLFTPYSILFIMIFVLSFSNYGIKKIINNNYIIIIDSILSIIIILSIFFFHFNLNQFIL